MKLDLTQLKEKTLDLTLKNGNTITIPRPSEEMLNELDLFRSNVVKQKKELNALKIAKEFTVKILNTNREGVKFDLLGLEIEGYDYLVCSAIVKTYSELVAEVMNNPN